MNPAASASLQWRPLRSPPPVAAKLPGFGRRKNISASSEHCPSPVWAPAPSTTRGTEREKERGQSSDRRRDRVAPMCAAQAQRRRSRAPFQARCYESALRLLRSHAFVLYYDTWKTTPCTSCRKVAWPSRRMYMRQKRAAGASSVTCCHFSCPSARNRPTRRQGPSGLGASSSTARAGANESTTPKMERPSSGRSSPRSKISHLSCLCARTHTHAV